MVEYIICYTYLLSMISINTEGRQYAVLCPLCVESIRYVIFIFYFYHFNLKSILCGSWVSLCALGPRASKRPKENNIPQIPWSLHTDDRIFIFTAHVCFADVVVTLSKKLYNAKPTSK